MFGLRPGRRLAVSGAAALLAAPAAASSGAALNLARGCYAVGQPVALSGSGFAPNRAFDLTDDGVDFGQSTTDASGGFAVSFRPGGLPAGVAQHAARLEASDGVSSARATFTLTRATGGRFLASRGRLGALRAPFEVWAFSPSGAPRPVYLHYVSPGGSARPAVRLGTASGQCGYLRTRPRSLFGFRPSPGTWTLQIDTRRSYSPRPPRPVVRLRATVG